MADNALLPGAKIIAVLVTDMVGSTEQLTRLGDEAWNAARARHFGLLREELARHDGVEVKNTGDGILAVFPSAVDAVRAAIAMQQAVDRHRQEDPVAGVEMKVGMHLGEPVHDESDVFGEAVVLASRLCAAAAPGQILTSPLLRALVAPRRELEFESAGTLTLKGLSEPVDAFSVRWSPVAAANFLDPVALPRQPSRFVDRDEEQERLAEWFRQACSGQRVLGLVGGEPGIGKSRLVSEAVLRAHEQGATVLWGRHFEESLAPHGGFVEALRRLFSWVEEHATLPALDAASRHLVALSPVFDPHGRDWEEGTGEESPGPPRKDPGTDRLRLFDAIDAVLHEASLISPVVLVLDDLQWADTATLLLLGHIARSPRPDRLLILGTFRDGEVERNPDLRATIADLHREHRVQRVHLNGLAEQAVADLVSALVETQLPDEAVRRVQEQTEGNPFFIEEVMAHLRETGRLSELDDPSLAALDVERIELPEGVAEVVGRRLSRLGADAMAVLGVAAVAGREFELLVVEAVSRLDRDVVVDALDEAIRAGLVAEDPVTVGRYQFTHSLVRRTLVQDLSATRRAHLHQRISETVEDSLPDDERDDTTELDRRRLIELAHHALAAVPLGDPWRAAHLAQRAGDRALSELAYEQAAELFDRATATLHDLVPTDRQAQELRARVWLGSGEALVLAGDFNGARDAFRQAIEDASGLTDGELRARATLGFGRALGSGVGFEFGVPSVELVRLLRDALDGLPPGDSEVRAMLTARLGAALGSSTDPSAAVSTARDALAMAERLGSPSTIAFCLISLRAAGWGRIDRDEQHGLGGRIVEVAAAAREPLLELHGRVWQIADALEQGDAEAADSVNAEVAEIVDRIQLPQFRWYLELYGSTRALLDGDLAGAEALSLQALERGSSMGDLNVELAFGAQSYLQWFERGWLEELVPIAEEQVAQYPTVTAWRAGLAQGLAAAGRTDDARSVMSAALHQLRSTPPDPLRPAALAILIDVASRLGDAEVARELHGLLAPHEGRTVMIAQMAGSLGSAAHHLGVATATAGWSTTALDHLRRAAEEHRRLRAPGWEARSLIAAAEVLLDGPTGDEATEEVATLLGRATTLTEGLDLPEVRRGLERTRARAARATGPSGPELQPTN